MHVDEQYSNGKTPYGDSAAYRRVREMFDGPPIDAEVPAIPAVRITRDQWAKIQACIAVLAELGDTGRPVEVTLIQGAVLAEAVADARCLRDGLLSREDAK